MPLEVSLRGLEPVIDRLNLLITRGEDLTEVLDEIGEDETDRVFDRFDNAKKPDGTPWAPLLRPRPNVIAGGEKVLQSSGDLYQSITHQVYGKHAVGIGVSPRLGVTYGKYHQFGRGRMHRPFLGVSEEAKNDIMDILHAHFIFI